MKINEENYELYLFQYAEGMLSDKECHEVEAFLDSHPDIREEFALYDPKLTVAGLPKMKYEDKAALKHNTFALWPVLRYAAAVLLLAAVVAFFLLRNGESTKPNTPVVAENQTKTTDTITSDETTPALQQLTQQPIAQAVTKETPVKTQRTFKTTQPIEQQHLAQTQTENDEPSQPSAQFAESTDTPTQNNELQGFVKHSPTPTKVVYTNQLITYSPYVAVMDEDESVPESSRLENFVINLGPVQAYMEIRNGIAYLKDRIGESDGSMLITLFSTKQPKE